MRACMLRALPRAAPGLTTPWPAGLVLGVLGLGALVLAALCAAPRVAGGAELLQLKDGPGRDLTVGRCIICHSLDYIPANAPAMDRAAWQKSLQKMRDRFGAPITDAEAKEILEYLDSNYSGKS
jgi:sulfite dehydrogenase (cytochrome) subunit B